MNHGLVALPPLLLLVAASAFGQCWCEPYTLAEGPFDRAGAVFVGEVFVAATVLRGVESFHRFFKTYGFRVADSWKGAAGDVVEVAAPREGPCSLKVEKGSYLVYADKSADWLPPGPNVPVLRIDKCSPVLKIPYPKRRPEGATEPEPGTVRDAALFLAVSVGDVELTRRLLAQGARTDWMDVQWRTPVDVALQGQSTGVIHALHEAGVTWTADSFRKALSSGRFENVRALVDDGLNLNDHTKTSCPLSLAAASGRLDWVRYLTSHGADPKHAEPDGTPGPLYHAATREIAEFLIAREAPLTPYSLMVAASGRPEVLPLLLDKGEDPNAQVGWGWTPLHVAAKSASVENVRLLLSAGADPNARALDGETPLMSFFKTWVPEPLPRAFLTVQALLLGGARAD
jgi:ankyrin repeat protein